MFPEQKRVGSINMQHKSKISKVMFTCRFAPRSCIGLGRHDWNLAYLYRERGTKDYRAARQGATYEVDVTIDGEKYRELYLHDLLPEDGGLMVPTGVNQIVQLPQRKIMDSNHGIQRDNPL